MHSLMIKRILVILIALAQGTLLSACFRQVAPDEGGPTYLEEGLIAYDQGHFDEAIGHLNNALKINPENTEARFKLGLIYQKQKRFDEALAAYRETVRVDRAHIKAHYNLANLYSYEKADMVQSIFHYRRFLSLSPGHPHAARVRKRLRELTESPDEKGLHHAIVPQGRVPETAVLGGDLIQPPTRPPQLPLVHLSSQPSEVFSFPQVVCLEGRAGQNKVEGSAFVVGAGGYLLSSGHQVDKATQLMARFQDGKSYPATVLAVSEALDLALLQIPYPGLAPLEFDRAPSPRVGDTVLAVGCPLGLDHSASQGIISAPERKLGGMRLLQTDVSINPGNSGGPLLNQAGEVTGVIVGVLPKANGIAFALPAEEAKRFLGATFFQIGNLFAEAKRYDEAAEALQTSLHFSPESATTQSNLGEVYRRMKQFKNAESAFLKAVSLDPRYAEAHYNLGVLYGNHLGAEDKAGSHFRAYLKLQPNAADASEVGQWLAAAESTE